MSQLMETLFDLMDGPHATEGERRAMRAARDAIKAADQKLTYDEFENLWDAIMSIGDAGHLDSFTLGFRLGVQLTLEGLRPIAGMQRQ